MPPLPIHPRYTPRDPSEPQNIASSIQVIRTSDQEVFLASRIPTVVTKDAKKKTYTTKLAAAVLPAAAIPMSRILNHPNIISVVDIVQNSSQEGSTSEMGQYGDITVWEDMNAGCLSYLIPSVSSYPAFTDQRSWHLLAAQNFNRFSLPESLCWHVLKSVSRALLWLHYGIKETEGIPEEFMQHDDDWQPILIMDVSPSQVWFKKPKGEETYGECKLGGFQWAKVTGDPGGKGAFTHRREDAPIGKQHFWAPVSIPFHQKLYSKCH